LTLNTDRLFYLLIVNCLRFSDSYLLVAHGSRDPHFQLSLKMLARLVQKQLENSLAVTQFKNDTQKIDKKKKILATELTPSRKNTNFLVATACLELSSQPLSESIEQFAEISDRAGFKTLRILPLFLAPGVHVKEDIPAIVEQLQPNLSEKITLDLEPYLGSNPLMSELLAIEFENLDAEARILIAHGSRRDNANDIIEAIALELKAQIAYWSISPQLAEKVKELVELGAKKIAIVPYFLFTGKITEAIAKQVQELETIFPDVELILGQPLGATSELAEIIVRGIIK
jgi:sirohydrochlorin cobaltochelatase